MAGDATQQASQGSESLISCTMGLRFARCASLDSREPALSLPKGACPYVIYQAAAMWSPDDLCIHPARACRNTGVPNIAIEKNRSLSNVPRKNGSPAA